MGVREEIKSYIVKSGLSMNEVVKRINEKYNKNISIANFSNKLARGTIKYREVHEIADILGYEMVWQNTQHLK